MGHFKVNQQVTVIGRTLLFYHLFPIGTKGIVIDVNDSMARVMDGGGSYQWIYEADLRHSFKDYVLCLE